MPPPTPGNTTLTNVYLGAGLTSGTIAVFSPPGWPVTSGEPFPWPQKSFVFTYIGINGYPPGPYSSSVDHSFSNDVVRFDGPFFDPITGDAFIKPTILPGISATGETEGTELQAETSTKEPEYDEKTDFRQVIWAELNDKGLACADRQLKEALEEYKDNDEYVEIIKRMQVGLDKEKKLREPQETVDV